MVVCPSLAVGLNQCDIMLDLEGVETLHPRIGELLAKTPWWCNWPFHEACTL